MEACSIMIQKIQLEEAEKNLKAIIHSALEGDEITITVDDEPVVKIVPVGKGLKNRKLGTAKGEVVIKSDFKEIPHEFEAYIP